jgi:hypothetical protein
MCAAANHSFIESVQMANLMAMLENLQEQFHELQVRLDQQESNMKDIIESLHGHGDDYSGDYFFDIDPETGDAVIPDPPPSPTSTISSHITVISDSEEDS